MRYAAPSLLALVFLMAAATVALPKLPQLSVGIVLALLTAFPLWNYYTKVDKDPWPADGGVFDRRGRSA